MPMGLTGSHKSNITTLMTDLTTAIDSLAVSDNAQHGVKALLIKFRTELTELIKNERVQ